MPIDDSPGRRAGTEEDPLEATGIGRSIELRPGGHLGDPNLLGTPVDADYPGFRRLTFFSVLGGVCPLLPEGAEAPAAVAVCTRMVAELEHSRGLGLEPDEVAVLAACDGAVETAAGRAGAWLQRALRRPFPRLTLRDGVRRSVETFARGYLLLHAAGLEMAELHPPDRTPEQVRQAREATDAALREADGRLAAVIAPVFQRSLGLLRQAAGVLAGFLGPAAAPRAGIPPGSGALRAEDKLLGGLVDQIALSLWNDREALAGLEKSFEGHLARQRGLTMPL